MAGAVVTSLDIIPTKSSLRLTTSSVSRSVDLGLTKSKNFQKFDNVLGRITGQASEFNKSLDAATARVFAFGATVSVLNSIRNSFAQLVQVTIDVDRRLTEIQAVLGSTDAEFNKLAESIFQVGIRTGQSFQSVASGAVELARQGLTAAENAERLEAALVLTNVSGIQADKSVKTLTATINGFSEAAVTAQEVVNKLVAVDTAFAVSADDLADGLSRAGSTAQDAGVSLDELLAIITAVEERTARGGAVIGNAFKTIFPRLQRPKTIEALRELGVAINETQSGLQQLQAIADTVKNLSDPTTQNRIFELAAGVRQINILSAAIKDLNAEDSTIFSAIAESADASNQAFEKNAQLVDSLAGKLNALKLTFTDIGSTIGDTLVAPIIDSISLAGEQISSGLKFIFGDKSKNDIEAAGQVIGKTFLNAFRNLLIGPGSVIAVGALLKILTLIARFAKQGFEEVFKIGAANDRIQNLTEGVNALLNKQSGLYEEIVHDNLSIEQKSRLILDTIFAQNRALDIQKQTVQDIVQFLRGSGLDFQKGLFVTAGKAPRRRAASGYQAEEAMEVLEARSLGATSSVKPRMSKGTIGGKKFIMNNQETEIVNFGKNGDSAVIPHYGKTKKLFSSGHIPNFASAKLLQLIAAEKNNPIRVLSRLGRPLGDSKRISLEDSEILDLERLSKDFIQKKQKAGSLGGIASLIRNPGFKFEAQAEKIRSSLIKDLDVIKASTATLTPKQLTQRTQKRKLVEETGKESIPLEVNVNKILGGEMPTILSTTSGTVPVRQQKSTGDIIPQALAANSRQLFTASFQAYKANIEGEAAQRLYGDLLDSNLLAENVYQNQVAPFSQKIFKTKIPPLTATPKGKELQSKASILTGTMFETAFQAGIENAVRNSKTEGDFDVRVPLGSPSATVLQSLFGESSLPLGGGIARSDFKLKATGSGPSLLRKTLAEKSFFNKIVKVAKATDKAGTAFQQSKAKDQRKARGFIPKSLDPDEIRRKLLEYDNQFKQITTKSGSFLEYQNENEFNRLLDLSSNRKGDAYNLFGRLVDKGKPVLSDTVLPQKGREFKSITGNPAFDALLNLYPQLRYRMREGYNTSGLLSVNKQPIKFNSIAQLRKGFKGIDPNEINDGVIELFDLKTSKIKGIGDRIARGYIPNFAQTVLGDLVEEQKTIKPPANLNRILPPIQGQLKDSETKNPLKSIPVDTSSVLPALDAKVARSESSSSKIPANLNAIASQSLIDAVDREKKAGVPKNQIRVGSDRKLMGRGNPLGLGVTNTTDEPRGLKDVFARGFIPNFAKLDIGATANERVARLQKELGDKITQVIAEYQKGAISESELTDQRNRLKQSYGTQISIIRKTSLEKGVKTGVVPTAPIINKPDPTIPPNSILPSEPLLTQGEFGGFPELTKQLQFVSTEIKQEFNNFLKRVSDGSVSLQELELTINSVEKELGTKAKKIVESSINKVVSSQTPDKIRKVQDISSVQIPPQPKLNRDAPFILPPLTEKELIQSSPAFAQQKTPKANIFQTSEAILEPKQAKQLNNILQPLRQQLQSGVINSKEYSKAIKLATTKLKLSSNQSDIIIKRSQEYARSLGKSGNLFLQAGQFIKTTAKKVAAQTTAGGITGVAETVKNLPIGARIGIGFAGQAAADAGVNKIQETLDKKNILAIEDYQQQIESVTQSLSEFKPGTAEYIAASQQIENLNSKIKEASEKSSDLASRMGLVNTALFSLAAFGPELIPLLAKFKGALFGLATPVGLIGIAAVAAGVAITAAVKKANKDLDEIERIAAQSNTGFLAGRRQTFAQEGLGSNLRNFDTTSLNAEELLKFKELEKLDKKLGEQAGNIDAEAYAKLEDKFKASITEFGDLISAEGRARKILVDAINKQVSSYKESTAQYKQVIEDAQRSLGLFSGTSSQIAENFISLSGASEGLKTILSTTAKLGDLESKERQNTLNFTKSFTEPDVTDLFSELFKTQLVGTSTDDKTAALEVARQIQSVFGNTNQIVKDLPAQTLKAVGAGTPEELFNPDRLVAGFNDAFKSNGVAGVAQILRNTETKINDLILSSDSAEAGGEDRKEALVKGFETLKESIFSSLESTIGIKMERLNVLTQAANQTRSQLKDLSKQNLSLTKALPNNLSNALNKDKSIPTEVTINKVSEIAKAIADGVISKEERPVLDKLLDEDVQKLFENNANLAANLLKEQLAGTNIGDQIFTKLQGGGTIFDPSSFERIVGNAITRRDAFTDIEGAARTTLGEGRTQDFLKTLENVRSIIDTESDAYTNAVSQLFVQGRALSLLSGDFENSFKRLTTLFQNLPDLISGSGTQGPVVETSGSDVDRNTPTVAQEIAQIRERFQPLSDELVNTTNDLKQFRDIIPKNEALKGLGDSMSTMLDAISEFGQNIGDVNAKANVSETFSAVNDFAALLKELDIGQLKRDVQELKGRLGG